MKWLCNRGSYTWDQPSDCGALSEESPWGHDHWRDLWVPFTRESHAGKVTHWREELGSPGHDKRLGKTKTQYSLSGYCEMNTKPFTYCEQFYLYRHLKHQYWISQPSPKNDAE